MNTRFGARAGVRVALLAVCLGLTATAYAADGGAQAWDGGGTTASAGDRHLRLGSTVRVRGAVTPPVAGQAVKLQLGVGRGWRTVGRARTRADGRFVAGWRPGRQGAFRLRVASRGPNGSVADWLERRVYVYRQSYAS